MQKSNNAKTHQEAQIPTISSKRTSSRTGKGKTLRGPLGELVASDVAGDDAGVCASFGAGDIAGYIAGDDLLIRRFLECG